jgi:hypothetical protein
MDLNCAKALTNARGRFCDADGARRGSRSKVHRMPHGRFRRGFGVSPGVWGGQAGGCGLRKLSRPRQPAYPPAPWRLLCQLYISPAGRRRLHPVPLRRIQPPIPLGPNVAHNQTWQRAARVTVTPVNKQFPMSTAETRTDMGDPFAPIGGLISAREPPSSFQEIGCRRCGCGSVLIRKRSELKIDTEPPNDGLTVQKNRATLSDHPIAIARSCNIYRPFVPENQALF